MNIYKIAICFFLLSCIKKLPAIPESKHIYGKVDILKDKEYMEKYYYLSCQTRKDICSQYCKDNYCKEIIKTINLVPKPTYETCAFLKDEKVDINKVWKMNKATLVEFLDGEYYSHSYSVPNIYLKDVISKLEEREVDLSWRKVAGKKSSYYEIPDKIYITGNIQNKVIITIQKDFDKIKEKGDLSIEIKSTQRNLKNECESTIQQNKAKIEKLEFVKQLKVIKKEALRISNQNKERLHDVKL